MNQVEDYRGFWSTGNIKLTVKIFQIENFKLITVCQLRQLPVNNDFRLHQVANWRNFKISEGKNSFGLGFFTLKQAPEAKKETLYHKIIKVISNKLESKNLKNFD